MRKTSGGAGVELQFWNTIEVSAITRHQLEFVMDGCHADQQVKVADEIALAAQRPRTRPKRSMISSVCTWSGAALPL